MTVALCVSGDFKRASNIVAAVCTHMLPEEKVDVFASLWTPAGVNERALRAWFDGQTSDRVRLRRWTFDYIQHMPDWDKFVESLAPKSRGYLQQIVRLQYALQLVSQLKAEQERQDGNDYDAVVRVESDVNLEWAPPLSRFRSILSDHVVIGHKGIMPWWPAYEFRVAMMSSRNMEVYCAIQTMHRRQYLLRYKTLDIQQAFVNHFHHARLKTLCMPVAYSVF